MKFQCVKCLKEFPLLAINKDILYYVTTTFWLIVMSQEATEKEITTALGKLTITNDLEKIQENIKTSSSFKRKRLWGIDRIKEKKEPLISTPSMVTYLGWKVIGKVSIVLVLNEMVKENVIVNKKTSLGDSFRRINTPPNLVNSLHTNSCPNNELAISESVNSKESAADNTPSTHADIQHPNSSYNKWQSFQPDKT